MAAKEAQAKTIFLKDYQVPPFLIDKTELVFDLLDSHADVHSTLHMRRNPDCQQLSPVLNLNGQDMELLEVRIDGKVLGKDCYELNDEFLNLAELPAEFTLQISTRIKPQDNTSLEGLYRSRTMYCTQCEAEGFRKITYYLDRPDVMSEFVTTVKADKTKFPVLLSNGNPIEEGACDDGRAFATWHDPFKKPAYLFALVAGDLDRVDDTFVTASGREVSLRIFVESKDVDKVDHAMESLKRSMRWDEEVYGREYDLDIFMIVAVDDFNMGAMENKGLNIFNTSCVLTKPEISTDQAYQRVEAIVAHEYFHNWTGNRVTCRDWFQLSLKEGFTVYRDAEFSADMGSATVKRVEDVSTLRTLQFAEDGGPMAHPVRPESYMEISNFYTLTIYEKGAELVRMIANLLGKEDFRKGSDLYFDRHDGQAVTTDDFVKAMEDASGKDLGQFRRWYSQAGTPVLDAQGEYDEEAQTFTLSIAQTCPPTPESAHKAPFHIPVAMGLLGEAGELALHLQGDEAPGESEDNTHKVLELTEVKQRFVFENVMERPVPSLLRGLSAPVRLNYNYSREDYTLMMRADSDGFSRWNASQQLGVAVIHEAMASWKAGKDITVDPLLVEAYRTVLRDSSLDKAMVALMLTLPTEAYLSELASEIDVDAIHYARNGVKRELAKALKNEFIGIYESYDHSLPYTPSAGDIAARSLCNVALSYLMSSGDSHVLEKCHQQYLSSNNMTDVMAALVSLVNSEDEAAEIKRRAALDDFFDKWKDEALVVNQWLSVQANCCLEGGLERVQALLEHPAFDIKNPNKARSLIGGFCAGNPVNFHRKDGKGYAFLAEQIIVLNDLNPQVASRLCGPLTKWKKYDAERQTLMQAALETIKAHPGLSKDVYEVVSKSLSA